MSIVTLSDRLAKALMVLAAAWAFVLTFIIIADIVGRNAFNYPVPGVREIVANSIVMIVFLQAGYAIRSRSMLRTDLLLTVLPDVVGASPTYRDYLYRIPLDVVPPTDLFALHRATIAEGGRAEAVTRAVAHELANA